MSQLSSNCLVGAREEPRITEQQFGNFQTKEAMLSYKAEREKFGRFYYRFPQGESGLDVYNRITLFIGTLFREWEKERDFPIEETNILIVTHGLALRLFLMRWFQFSVHEFEHSRNPGNAAIVVMTRSDVVSERSRSPSFPHASVIGGEGVEGSDGGSDGSRFVIDQQTWASMHLASAISTRQQMVADIRLGMERERGLGEVSDAVVADGAATTSAVAVERDGGQGGGGGKTTGSSDGVQEASDSGGQGLAVVVLGGTSEGTGIGTGTDVDASTVSPDSPLDPSPSPSPSPSLFDRLGRMMSRQESHVDVDGGDCAGGVDYSNDTNDVANTNNNINTNTNVTTFSINIPKSRETVTTRLDLALMLQSAASPSSLYFPSTSTSSSPRDEGDTLGNESTSAAAAVALDE